MIKKHAIGYPLTAVIALGIGAASSGAAPVPQSSAATTTVTATVTSRESAPAGPIPPSASTTSASPQPAKTTATESSVPGDGTYQVGVDIRPGTYVSDTPDSGNCYWARLSGQDSLAGIIANNNSKGRSVVTIAKTDKLFESSGCSPWTKR